MKSIVCNAGLRRPPQFRMRGASGDGGLRPLVPVRNGLRPGVVLMSPEPQGGECRIAVPPAFVRFNDQSHMGDAVLLNPPIFLFPGGALGAESKFLADPFSVREPAIRRQRELHLLRARHLPLFHPHGNLL